MGSGFKDWSPGDVLTAADVDGYLMRQAVMTFADASARDTALSGVLDEGMVAYLEDTNAITVYNGSSWVSVIDSDVLTVDTSNNRVGINDSTPSYALDVTGDINATSDLRIGGTAIGEWTTFTPTWTFGANAITSTATGRYTVVNDIVIVQAYMSFTSAAAGGDLRLTVPSDAAIAALVSNFRTGYGSIFDASLTQSYSIDVYNESASTTVFKFLVGAPGFIVSDTSPFTFVSTDEVFCTIIGQAP